MSRETYQPPTLPSTSQSNPAATSSTSQQGSTPAFSLTGNQSFGDDSANRPVTYLCGDCDARFTLKKGDAIRCKECGYRVLYKERTTK